MEPSFYAVPEDLRRNELANRGVITSDGNILNLDEDNEVQDLPPESIVARKRTFGGMNFPHSFISSGNGQWYDEPKGYVRLQNDFVEMDRLPFQSYLKQEKSNRNISFLLTIPYNGFQHQTVLTYDRFYPDLPMHARILYPSLDERKMGGHVYPDGEICYIKNWNRSIRAIHVAVQVAFWIKDYWDGKLTNYSYAPIFPDAERFESMLRKLENQWR